MAKKRKRVDSLSHFIDKFISIIIKNSPKPFDETFYWITLTLKQLLKIVEKEKIEIDLKKLMFVISCLLIRGKITISANILDEKEYFVIKIPVRVIVENPRKEESRYLLGFEKEWENVFPTLK